MNLDPERMKSLFVKTYDAAPAAWARAPGRVEVLGNHTDYNEGFILSAAIDRHIMLAGRPVGGDTARVFARAFNAAEEFDVRAPAANTRNPWINYIAGVVDQLNRAGHRIGAFEAVVDGNVPPGAGLSSSAALELATALFLRRVFGFQLDAIPAARLCQAAENRFVGVQCGILDQFSSAMGRRDQLIFLDCRDLDKYEHAPLGEDVELVLANTRAPHQLVDGAYNRLRESCFRAARYFAGLLPDRRITHLRDVTLDDLERHGAGLAPEDLARARHIVSENERVLAGMAALRSGDRETMGRRMTESHASSRDDFRNSCPELDAMVECALPLTGCYGARLSGGGFGGCTVNLVAAARSEAFAVVLAEKYRQKTGIAPEIHRCRAVDGARAELY